LRVVVIFLPSPTATVASSNAIVAHNIMAVALWKNNDDHGQILLGKILLGKMSLGKLSYGVPERSRSWRFTDQRLTCAVVTLVLPR
jgi:hypothetical protein